MRLANKTIWVTGGSGDIGLACSQLLIQEGAFLVNFDLKDPDVNPEQVRFYLCDCTDPQDVKKNFQKVMDEVKTLDGLLHIAGGSGRKFGDGPLHDLTLTGWNKTIEMNLTSAMLSNQLIIQHWIESNLGGSIVNVSSVLADHPAPKYFYTHAYAAAKAGLNGFTKSIAAYYADRKIRANVISPGLIATNMSARAQQNEDIQHYLQTKQPLQQGMGLPKDIAGIATLLLSDESSFITGQIIDVDGGWGLSEGQY